MRVFDSYNMMKANFPLSLWIWRIDICDDLTSLRNATTIKLSPSV